MNGRNLSKRWDECDTQIISIKISRAEFEEGCKMKAHSKTHKKFQCNKCDKAFRYLDTMNKHVKIHHGNLKLSCHYFSHKKTCSYDETFIFLHQKSVNINKTEMMGGEIVECHKANERIDEVYVLVFLFHSPRNYGSQ